ncbi:MAG: 50S ribosomal protein L3 N(5)-glutamine methyltransferase [Porticoccaceae bacterium]
MSFQLSQITSYQSALEQAATYMEDNDLWFGHGTDNAWDESVALLLWSAALPVSTGPDILKSTLEPEVQERFVAAVNRRVEERIPAAYITQEAWFNGLSFYVNKDVLVPRSPIAELICNGFQPWVKIEPASILDLCCGSGCIGIAAALEFPRAKVVLADLSSAALVVAKSNTERHKCADRVSVVQGNLFEPINGQLFDLIVCNPPYVSAEDLANMPSEYNHEPSVGLGSGEDGLDLTRKILKQAPASMSAQGILVLEVGNSWRSLEAAYPGHSFLWLDFENGGEGVCVLTREELLQL